MVDISKIYANLIKLGVKTIRDVPLSERANVTILVEDDNNKDNESDTGTDDKNNVVYERM